MNTEIREQEISKVFEGLSGSQVRACVARLSVLYEDLRIETSGMYGESLPHFDVNGKVYRRLYFLRRAILSACEFAEALRLLDECPDFKSVKARLAPELSARWDQGVYVYSQHEPFLKKVRNDIGGHFGHAAAKYAIENLVPTTIGRIRIEKKEKTIHLYFAEEIAATAMKRNLSSEDAEFSQLSSTAVACFKAATECVHCIVISELWERFHR